VLLHLLRHRCVALRTHNEVLHPNFRAEGSTNADILEQALRWQGNRVRILGCKVFYDQITRPRAEGLLQTPRLKVVHLQRRNWLGLYVIAADCEADRLYAQRTPADGRP
jgi:hypothetical protein